MKKGGFFVLLGASVLSTVVLLYPLSKWNGGNLRKTPVHIIRQSVMLRNGSYRYHLNLTSFENEFPHLQSYRCALIQKPEEHVERSYRLLILAVKSHPSAGGRRLALRKTWATGRVLDGYRLRPVFLLGDTTVAGHMEIVKLESQVYRDILQWDIMEGHHNLSLKESCFLEWLHLHFPQVDFVFKGDDDVFVNPEMIVQYILEHGSPNTIHGFYQYRPAVMRHTKYRINMSLYPQDRYPGFVSGGGFLFPGAAVNSLYEASRQLPVFPLDDVYFGFLSLMANLTYRHEPRFYTHGLKYEACRYKQALVVHGIGPEIMEKIWREVQDAKCNKPVQSRKTGAVTRNISDVHYIKGSLV